MKFQQVGLYMKNNKGQTLVTFVIMLPIIIILLAAIIDIGYMYMETSKVNSINRLVIDYGLDNLKTDNIDTKITNLVKENDEQLKVKELKIEDNKIKLEIEKNMKSIFGQVIGIKTYKIVSNYEGILKENKKQIIKG